MSTPRLRFAPSPTGPLHMGGVRTALYNYLFARQKGGTLILRIEDTDQDRYVPGAEEYIIEALQWCGIRFDEGPHVGGPHAPYRQSERKAMYRQYAEQLVASGHAYYAFDTREELEAMRERLEKSGNKSPGYTYLTREHMQNSLVLPATEVENRLKSGLPYVVRIKLPRKHDIRFQDRIRGWVTVNTSQLDDKVLLKSDGMPTYHLANVVDDHLMGITHVIRGEEWLPSTPLHVYMYESFGWQMPEMAHLPLLLKPNGQGKLSKRDGDELGFPVFPLQWTNPETGEISSGYREQGYLPEAFLNFLALLGWHPSSDQEVFRLEELIAAFDLERVSKSGAKFDKAKLVHFNQLYLKQLPNSLFVDRLKELAQKHGESPSAERLESVANMLKERMEVLNDLERLSGIFWSAPQAYDPDFAATKWSPEAGAALQQAATALEATGVWTHEEIRQIMHRVADAGGMKLGKLMPAARLALTGSGAGPDLVEFMHWLGANETARRFRLAVETLG